MPLINFEINLFLTWSLECIIVIGAIDNQITTFAISNTSIYFSVVTISAQDNAKLLQQ